MSRNVNSPQHRTMLISLRAAWIAGLGRTETPGAALAGEFFGTRVRSACLALSVLGLAACCPPCAARQQGAVTGPGAQPGYSAAMTSAPAPSAQTPAPAEPGPSLSATSGAAAFTGKATYYSDRLAGHRTASGARYEPRAFTAAHRTLPFGTLVAVTRLDTGESVRVTITDRGPFGSEARIIDLSRAAAEKLRMLRAGVVSVRIDVLQLGAGERRAR